jgi:hypothetical protein
VIFVSYLNQSSILRIIKSKFKKFLDLHLYFLLLIPLLFIVYHSINGLSVPPADNNQSVLNLDFERQKVSISPIMINLFHSINYSNESSTSLKKSISIFGNSSLRVDIKPANTTKWKTISTDFIPVNENASYNASLYISAKNVNQLHSKINYYDSNKTKIKSTFIFDGRNGTFDERYNKVDSSPNGTKYMKLLILVRDNPKIYSSYLIDNVKIENIPDFTNNDNEIIIYPKCCKQKLEM